MTTPADCTCQSNCGACGPSGTGCGCPKGKCNCKQCANSPHSNKCECRGSGDNCVCTTQGRVCTCESK
ncbi:hypothetical protein L210DRAFT_956957 [Boletus edulis BED1]|uniref:Metallothionein n=1 Tax=Boletus edulis BED1 TaxID=1328754 RepID=A0AAD4BC68_BOLED|nr:hypothetical protein L210DRAFT_956957 [Boletus edulis BED1]